MEMSIANGTGWVAKSLLLARERAPKARARFFTSASLFYTSEVDKLGDTASVSDD
jgi:hypothetical protein